MKKCVLVLGGTGRAGKDFEWLHKRERDQRFISQSEAKLVFLSKEECDVTSVLSVVKAAERCRMSGLEVVAVLNLAAFTNVDKFESDSEYRSAGRCVNALSAYSLYAAAEEIGEVPIVHVSSEYVFRRKATPEPYFVEEQEDATRVAYTEYGESKRLFEMIISSRNRLSVSVIRTSGLYSSSEDGPVYNLVKCVLDRDSHWTQYMSSFSDWYFSPTSTVELFCAVSQVLRMIINKSAPPRILNVSGGSAVTKLQHAEQIVSRVQEISDIDSDIKFSERSVSEISSVKRPFGLCLSTKLLDKKFMYFDTDSRNNMVDMLIERAINRYIDKHTI